MNARTRATSLLAIALLVSACGAGPGTDTVSPTQFDDEDLPEWVMALPEGTEPRDNDHTAEAELFLFQASQSDDPDDWQAALDAARAGIEEDPENPQSYFHAGRAYLGLGDLRAAGEMFDRAEEIYPRYVIDTEFFREQEWIEQYNAALEYLPDQTENAATHLEMAHAIYQHRPEAAIQLAAIRADQGRNDEAIELFGAVIEVMESPRMEEVENEELLADWMELYEIALFNLGQLLFQEERYADAADVYERIVELLPDDLMAQTNLAAALVTSGQTERAAALYDELLNRDDLSGRDFFMVGVGLFEADQLEAAARAFAEAHAAMPQAREPLFNYVQTLYLADMFEELVEVAPRLLELDPHKELAYQFYAQGLVQLEEEHRAVEIMEEMQALPFSIEGLQLGLVDGGAAVAGQMTNRNASPGDQVRVRVHFYDEDGGEVGAEEVTVTLGDVDEPVVFQADLATGVDVAGYSYEIL